MDKAVEINNRGARLFLNRQFDEAEKCYKEALKLDPDHVTAMNNMGLLLHQKKQYRKAIEYYEKAAGIRPKATYYVNAGNAAACLNEAAEAESWYRKALVVNSGSTSAKESLAGLYEHHNKIREAAAIWLDLVRATGEERYKTEYAKNLMKQERYSEASEILYNLGSEEESNTWYFAGICEYQLKNYGLAEEALKKSLAIDPDREEVRHYLAVTCFAMGKMEKGIDQLDKIIRMNPENYRILTEKGVILLSVNHPDEALGLFEKSLSIQPGYKKAEKYRKMALEMIGGSEKEDKSGEPG